MVTCISRRLYICLVLALAMPLYGGTLRLGSPVIEDNQYTFPVYLQDGGGEVAALDFRLAYDPAVFSPVGVHSGASAASAQKQVSSNLASPGEFVVVMMGFNQNPVPPGKVLDLVMEKISDPADGLSILRIAEPTMATVDGDEISSSGLARTVRFGNGKDGKEEPEPDEEDPDADAPDPDAGDSGTGERPAPRSPGPPILLSDLETGSARPTGRAGRLGPGVPSPIAATATGTATELAPGTGTPADIAGPSETSAPADPELRARATRGESGMDYPESGAESNLSGGTQPAPRTAPEAALSEVEKKAGNSRATYIKICAGTVAVVLGVWVILKATAR